MADQPTGPDTGAGPGRAPTTGMPRWVKVFLIIVIVAVLAFVVSIIAGVRHGPGLHSPPGDGSGHTSPVEHGP